MKEVTLYLILGSIGIGVWSQSMKSMTGCDKVCGIAAEPNGGSDGGDSQSK